jgi:hypothetical protein
MSRLKDGHIKINGPALKLGFKGILSVTSEPSGANCFYEMLCLFLIKIN